MNKNFFRFLLLLLIIPVIFIFGSIWFKNDATIDCEVVGKNLQLGNVNFPTSTSFPEAQAHFNLGVRYLHNFMYPLAIREFTLAKQIDPSYAMSYWGLAMSYNWSLWSYLDKAKGQKVFYDFEDAKNVKMTPLEKELIAAIRLIYGPGTIVENEKKYAHAMSNIYHRYPTNPDVASFYALSLMGYATDSPFDNKDSMYLQQARDVLKPFFKNYPAHPGIIHYYIHATDIPNSHYPKDGLAVIKNIYQHMNDSSHVLHMPSHLYTELGMWPEGAHANQLSIAASNRFCHFLESKNIHLNDPIVTCSASRNKKVIKWSPKKWYACDADNVYHSAEWLQYEYLQMGQFQKAEDVVDQMKKIVNIVGEPMYDYWYYRTKARQILYTENWKPITSLHNSITEEQGDVLWAAYSECGMLLADGLRAIHNNQTQYFPEIEGRYKKIFSILDKNSASDFRTACSITQAEFLAAKKYYIDKNKNESIEILENGWKIQHKYQSAKQELTLPFIPLQEIYAEILLQEPSQQNIYKAISLYENDLQFNPNRFQAMLGMARAEAKLNNKEKAVYWYKKLIEQFKAADSIGVLKEAKEYLLTH